MGVGPNYGLDKGCLATGATAYQLGLVLKLIANPNSSLSTVANAVVQATTANDLGMLVICQEDLDTTRLATGKALIDCRFVGLSRVLAGAAVAIGDRVTNDATARAVPRTRAAAGAQPAATFGYALTSASAAGQYIDVWLTPGATF
jgi:hypothetical protein